MHIIKPKSDKPVYQHRNGTMHGSNAERRIAISQGKLMRWGSKPGGIVQNNRPWGWRR